MNSDYNYIYKQSGVIPFKIEEGILKVLVITSRRTKQWIFPKGIVELNMSPQESAEEEAFEEAGVSGKVFNKELGSYTVKKWGGECTVTLYPMKVTKEIDNWPESFMRKRKWFSINEACKNIAKEEIVNILRRLPGVKEIKDMIKN